MRLIPAITFVALALFATGVAAQKSPAELLAEVDTIVGANVNQAMEWEAVTSQGGKEVGRITFRTRLKGTLWRRVDFESPANLKGMRVLVRSPEETYIYLPEFRKVRRVASHTKEQGFMGTAFDADDIALAVYGGIYEAQSVADKGLFWTISAKRRPNKEFPYDHIELDVRKDMKQPIELRFFDVGGQKLKTEKRSDFTCGFGMCSPRSVTITDHTRGDLTTHMSLKDWKAKENLPDALFTVRALERD